MGLLEIISIPSVVFMACASCGFGDTPTGQGCALEYEEMGAIQLKATSALRLDSPIPCTESTCIPQDVKSLAMSYIVSSDAPSLVQVYRPIFDFSYEDVATFTTERFNTTTIEGDSVEDWAADLSGKLNVSASYYAFSGSAAASFKQETSQEVRTFRRDTILEYSSYQVSNVELQPYKKLTADAKRILMTEDIDKIQKELGDFYATSVTFGGSLTNVMTTSLRKDYKKAEVAAQATASYNAAVIKGSAEAQFDTQVTTESSQQTFRSETKLRGGEASVWMGLPVDGNWEDFKKIQKEWKKTITRENQDEIRFILTPIWDLLDHTDMNKTKAEELKNYMLNKWAENGKIPEYPYVKETWTILGIGGCHDSSGGGAMIKEDWGSTFDDCKSYCENKNDGMWRCDYITYFRVGKLWAKDGTKMVNPAVCLAYAPFAQCDASPLDSEVNLSRHKSIPKDTWQDKNILTLKYNRP